MDTSGYGDGGGGYMQDNQFASPSASSQEKKVKLSFYQFLKKTHQYYLREGGVGLLGFLNL